MKGEKLMRFSAKAVLLGVAISTLCLAGAGSASADSGEEVRVKKTHETVYASKTKTPVPLVAAPIPAHLCSASSSTDQSIVSGGDNTGNNAAATQIDQDCDLTINNTIVGEPPARTEKRFFRDRSTVRVHKKK